MNPDFRRRKLASVLILKHGSDSFEPARKNRRDTRKAGHMLLLESSQQGWSSVSGWVVLAISGKTSDCSLLIGLDEQVGGSRTQTASTSARGGLLVKDHPRMDCPACSCS